MSCKLNFASVISVQKEMAWLEEQIKACNRAHLQPENAASVQTRCVVDSSTGAVTGPLTATTPKGTSVTTAELRDRVTAKYRQVANCLTAPTAASLAILQAEHTALRAKFDSVQARQHDAMRAKAKLVGTDNADGHEVGGANAADTVISALFPPAAPWDEAGHAPWSEYTAILLATSAAILVSYVIIVRAAS